MKLTEHTAELNMECGYKLIDGDKVFYARSTGVKLDENTILRELARKDSPNDCLVEVEDESFIVPSASCEMFEMTDEEFGMEVTVELL